MAKASSFVIPSIFTAIDKMSATVAKMERNVKHFADETTSRFDKVAQSFDEIGAGAFRMSGKFAAAGAAILAPMGVAANSAIEFEDKMADVAKTTGLGGKELEQFGASLLAMSKGTRSSIDDLLKIGEIGGQLGVAKDELIAFTDASNKFAVALGKDYSGGVEEAISQVGKIKNLFKDTRSLDISQVITRSGSAINELGAVGAGTSANINDFILRVGKMPDAFKPTMAATAALGTFLEEMGIDAERGASGFNNFALVAGKNIGKFAQQMHVSEAAAKQLFAQDPVAFATKFSESLKSMSPDQLSKKLEELGVGSQETIGVVGALGSAAGRLATLQGLSNKAFGDAISLQAEYDKKNSTTAALLAQAKNNFESLSITIGTKLIPVVIELVNTVAPVIERISTWIGQNPELTRTILEIAGTLGGLLLAISGVSFFVGILTKLVWLGRAAQAAYNLVLGFSIGLQKKSAFYVMGNRLAYKAYRTAVLLAEAAQWGWNAAMGVGLLPLLLIVAGVALLIAVIYSVVKRIKGWGEQWDEITKWMGRQWEAFKTKLMLGYKVLEFGFMLMVDAIVLAWKWGQNKIGNLSDEQFAKDKARIKKETAMRVAGIKQATAEMINAQKEALKLPEWKLQWKTAEDIRAEELAAEKEDGGISRVSDAMKRKGGGSEEMMEQISGMINGSVNGEILVKNQSDSSVTAKSRGSVNVRTTPTTGNFAR